jgi:catechol 2,3-dioxygenase-like lactoylglutathione lyase family enzyme/uncharacterized protein YunC (DUF1805 family)
MKSNLLEMVEETSMPTTVGPLPRTTSRLLHFAGGTAIGVSNRWHGGQYCAILTEAGIVGCGIYSMETPTQFGQAIAIAKGTPARPLTEPEDLFDAKIVEATPQAVSMGVAIGMTGREATEKMLAAAVRTSNVVSTSAVGRPFQVRSIDHVTLVVADLARSRAFYVDLLGMQPISRPPFSFDGTWFQAGATQIHLILEHAESGPAGNLEPRNRLGMRSHHLAFEVADASAAAAWLRERGVPIIAEAKFRPDGAVQTFVTDPDGHLVELTTFPWKHEHDARR